MFEFGVMLSVENYNAVRDERERMSQRGRWLGELRALEAQDRATAKLIARSDADCDETSPSTTPLGRNAGQPT